MCRLYAACSSVETPLMQPTLQPAAERSVPSIGARLVQPANNRTYALQTRKATDVFVMLCSAVYSD